MEGIKITDTISVGTDSTSNTPYDDAFRTMMGKSGGGTLVPGTVKEMLQIVAKMLQIIWASLGYDKYDKHREQISLLIIQI